MSKDSSVKSASACLVALFSLVTFAGEATPNPEDILLNGLRIAKDMVDKAQTGELPIKPGDIPIPGMKSGAPVEKSKTSDAPAAAAPIKEAPKTKATASVTTTTSSTTFTLPDCDIWLYPSGNALFFRDTEKTPTKPGSPYFMLREESDSWKLASSKGSKKVYSLAKQSPDACILLMKRNLESILIQSDVLGSFCRGSARRGFF